VRCHDVTLIVGGCPSAFRSVDASV